jgi:hypothetical protein
MRPEEIPFTPLPAVSATANVFACGLCGNRFTHGGLVCGSCPMQTGCELVRCPNCGFQFPRTSRIAAFFVRLFRRSRRSP